jgi:hypothetical protein
MSLDRSMLPLPRTLALPTRDFLRGMRRAVSVRRGPLGTVLAALGPARSEAPGASSRSRLTAMTPADRAILAEAGALLPGALDGARTRALVSIVYRGLSILLERLNRTDLMISETVVDYGLRIGLRSAADTPAERAAAIAISLLRHHAIGCAPGTPLALRDGDMRDERLAIAAVMLWLVIERGGRASAEADLLSLCFEVASLEEGAIREAGEEPAEMARLLRTFAPLI